MAVFRSKWGYHPCDYEPFKLLKKLNGLYAKSRRRVADWQRWFRKKPANRVMRQPVCNEQGQKIGSRPVAPRPEPKLSSLFCRRGKVPGRWSDAGEWLEQERLV